MFSKLFNIFWNLFTKSIITIKGQKGKKIGILLEEYSTKIIKRFYQFKNLHNVYFFKHRKKLKIFKKQNLSLISPNDNQELKFCILGNDIGRKLCRHKNMNGK